MAKRPSERYELVESLNRFSRFDEAPPVVRPVAVQRRSFLTTVPLRCSCMLQALTSHVAKLQSEVAPPG